MNILESLNWRYATKKFDPSKKVSEEDLNIILDSFVLTPSSFGLQPWKLLVVTDQAVKESLVPHSWNQMQVADCSHLLVFTYKKSMDEAYIANYIQRVMEVRGIEDENDLKYYKQMMIGALTGGARSPEQLEMWARSQVYIALGQMMAVAAEMKIDSCPMEGFAADEYDSILKLTDTDYKSSVLLPIGYRHDEDPYIKLKKVRSKKEEVIDFI